MTALDDTLDYLLEAARQALTQGESFVPFGGGARVGGEPLHFDVTPEQAKDAQGAIALITAGIQNEHARAPLAAAGLAFVAEVMLEGTGATAALCAHAEIPGGPAVNIIQAFIRDPAVGLRLAPELRRDVEPEIFR